MLDHLAPHRVSPSPQLVHKWPLENAIREQEADIIQNHISSHLHRIDFQTPTEIDSFAREVLNAVSQVDESLSIDFPALQSKLRSLTKLTWQTRQSMQTQLEIVAEMYAEPEIWIQKHKIKAFRSLIAARVQFTANRFLKLGPDVKLSLIADAGKHRAFAVESQNRLKRARSEGVRAENTTLSKAQFEQELHINALVKDLELTESRDWRVPLHDDLPLIVKIMERQPSFYGIFKTYLRDSKSAAIAALERGFCRLEFLDKWLRDDVDAQAAAKRRNFHLVEFCVKYYKLRPDISDFSEIAQTLSTSEVALDLEESAGVASELMSFEEVDQITNTALHHFAFQDSDVEGVTQSNIEYFMHWRMLLNDIFKKENMLEKLSEFVDSPCNGCLDERLTCRAKRMLQYLTEAAAQSH